MSERRLYVPPFVISYLEYRQAKAAAIDALSRLIRQQTDANASSKPPGRLHWQNDRRWPIPLHLCSITVVTAVCDTEHAKAESARQR